jgi:hypothetical protein
VYVENQEDVEEEAERVAILCKGLRIQAIIKPVWLNSTTESGSVCVSKEYTRQVQIHKRNLRFAFIRNQRKLSKKRPLDNVVEGVSSLETPVLSHSPSFDIEDELKEKKAKVKPKRSFVVTKISRQMLKHFGSTEDVRDALPIASPIPRSLFSSPATIDLPTSPRSESPDNLSDGEQSDGDDPDEVMEDKEGTGPLESASIFNTLEANVQHKILNELMVHHSRDSACIFRYLMWGLF